MHKFYKKSGHINFLRKKEDNNIVKNKQTEKLKKLNINVNTSYEVLAFKAKPPAIIKKENRYNKPLSLVLSFFAGVINGLFGGGAGMLIVVMLNKVFKLSEKQSHASAVFIVLPLCVVSIILYIFTGNFDINNGYFVILGAVLGGYLGAKLLQKLNVFAIKFLFAFAVLYCAIKLLIG